MQKLIIKEKDDKLLLLFELGLSRLDKDYWKGIYIKELYFCSIQTANRNYSYIDLSVIRQMLPNDWYIDFNVVNQVPFFSLNQYNNPYMHRWYGESIAQSLIADYPVEFTKIKFTESGELVL
jgi:hypothetical protein